MEMSSTVLFGLISREFGTWKQKSQTFLSLEEIVGFMDDGSPEEFRNYLENKEISHIPHIPKCFGNPEGMILFIPQGFSFP